MSRRFLLAVAALLAAGPALAGGFSAPVVVPAPAAPMTPPPVMAPTIDWSGFYLGGQLGRGDLATVRVDDGGTNFEGSGTLHGLHAGYMRDFGRLVVGAELDWDRVGIDLQDPEEDDPSGSVGSIARAKLRLGFDAGRFLPYVTAGVARISFDGFNEEFLDPESRGRVLGLGATFAVSDRFTVGLEALRHDFDDTPDRVGDPSQFDTEIDTVSLRGSFRF